MHRAARGLVLLLGALLSLVAVTTVGAASITVNPATVSLGGTVTLSGDVLGPNGQPGCQVPGTVTLISGAFAGQGSFMNQDVEATAAADGTFSVQATILAGVAPGTYTVTGRCGGGNLGVQATLVVTAAGLPSTGTGGVRSVPTAGRPTTLSVLVMLGAALLLLLTGGIAWHTARTA
jgi:hypothetical protein